MKTLDEQIEYMRFEVDWYKGKVANSRLSGSIWGGYLDTCLSILDTLKQLKENSNVI